MSRILVSGSLAFDRIMNFHGVFADHIIPEIIHQVNLSFFVPELIETFGGCAGNIAYNLALLGEEAVIIARAGKDFAPYGAWLKEKNVDTSMIVKDDTAVTSVAHIITDVKDNQIAAFHPGAALTPYDFSEVFLNADYAIIGPGNPDDMRRLPSLLKDRGIPYAYDPGQQIPTLSKEDLKDGMMDADVLISNDYELELIMKKTGLSEKDIAGNTRTLVTTLGEKGSKIVSDGKTMTVPAGKPKSAEDPTGAGDAYRAGYVHGRLTGWSEEISAKFAGVVACYTVEALGTQTHSFTMNDLAVRYKENFNEPLPV